MGATAVSRSLSAISPHAKVVDPHSALGINNRVAGHHRSQHTSPVSYLELWPDGTTRPSPGVEPPDAEAAFV
ncbi:hypothetical protein [Streptomyces aquilus]|uniref:hypothetical protein n=1 Tax=Streptomyces aquilus TaxID=2548456 RepID=UPI0036C3D252